MRGAARRFRRACCATDGGSEQAGEVHALEAVGSDMVEIVIGDAVVRAGGDVDPGRLARIIRAVRKALTLPVWWFTCRASRSTSARARHL